MDVIIPGHNLKAFSSSLAAMSKIGKDLYLAFDPLSGLTLRTLNDAKSAYAEFHFEVGFFERCTSPPDYHNNSLQRRDRRRRDLASRHRRRRKRPRSQGSQPNQQDSSNSQEDSCEEKEEEEEVDDDKYVCRVPIRIVATTLRQRKGVRSLRIKSVGSTPGDARIEGQSSQESTASMNTLNMMMQLSFEFIVTSESNGTMRIVHKVGVTDADGVAAVAPKEDCSEIVAPPKVLLKMLEPLKRTNEVALTVSDVLKVVTATSFHHTDAAAASTHNILLHATAAAVLKTETSIGCNDFDEYNWTDGRGYMDEDDLPDSVNQEVTLVFGIKEAKAMLQFCSQSNIDEELRIIVSFHWGGRPITFETEGDTFTAVLILATLDHKLLRGLNTGARQQQQQQQRQQQRRNGSYTRSDDTETRVNNGGG